MIVMFSFVVVIDGGFDVYFIFFNDVFVVFFFVVFGECFYFMNEVSWQWFYDEFGCNFVYLMSLQFLLQQWFDVYVVVLSGIDILVVIISLGFSGSCNVVVQVCDFVGWQVMLYDFMILSVVQVFQVYVVNVVVQWGESMEMVIVWMNVVQVEIELQFIIEMLEYLCWGGCIGIVVVVLGGLFNFKFVVMVDKKIGIYVNVGCVCSYWGGIEVVISQVICKYGEGILLWVGLFYGMYFEDVDQVLEQFVVCYFIVWLDCIGVNLVLSVYVGFCVLGVVVVFGVWFWEW